jgi:hypothetical protein
MKRLADQVGHPRKDAVQVGILAMMAMMMSCCLGIFLLVAIIPLIGWPAGIVLAVAGGVALTFVHRKFMGHGSHQ